MRIFGFDCFAPKLTQDVSPLSGVYSWKPLSTEDKSPTHRSFHTICRSGQFLYLYGGRGTKGTQHDLWKYNINDHVWQEVKTTGDRPPPLEGHTVVAHRGKHYYFGGEMSFASAGEVPLWIFDPVACTWVKKSEATLSPTARREHIAVVYEDQMFIHGGYIDLKGPSNDMWAYAFNCDTWKQIQFDESLPNPGSLYKHAACVHENYMWMCGGLGGISDRNDMQVWTWDFYTFVWCHIRTKSAPWQLYNHALYIVSDTVFVFGGSREDGDTCSKLWEVRLDENSWTGVQVWHSCQFLDKVRPSPAANHCIIALPEVESQFPSKKRIFSDVKTFTPLLISEKRDQETKKVPTNEIPILPDFSEPLIIPKPSAKEYFKISEDITSEEDFILSPENGETEIETEIVNTDVLTKSYGSLCIDEDYFCNNQDRDQLLGIKSERKDSLSQMGLHNAAFVNHSNPEIYNSKLVGTNNVKHFSYNLSEQKQWQPGKDKNPKFQSTSFIQVVPSAGKTVTRFSSDATVINKSTNSCQFEDSFVKNASAFDDIDKNVNREPEKKIEQYRMTSDLHLSRLLLIGGKMADSSLNIDRPLCMWQCQLNSNL
uniref:Kelch repeat-containing protein 2-like n=1 Tax=Phallusia mammillata TaxID=59560 RepID=A0A6F9DJH8_9ASCI|nr:kelch repeat-containing protein 2-like [Phallusia mammillata]